MEGNRLSLAGTWKRSIGGKGMDFVAVPGCYPPVGECVLERPFESPWPADGAGRFFLVTEGVLASAEFSLNGQTVGQAGPWARYRFELPPGLMRGQNALRATVRDILETFGPTPGRRFDAGLVRDLWIERRGASFIESVAFRPVLNAECTAAECTVIAEVNGPASGEVEAVLTQRDNGRVVASAKAPAGKPIAFRVDFPALWSPRMPNLYTLTVRLRGAEEDVVEETVGFRRIEIRGQDFYLNNQRLVLKGVCRHEFTTASGYSPTEAEVRRELALIRHSGFNYIRLVHSPQAPIVPRVAAEEGILVSEEPGTCFHDLGDQAVAAPALESLRRTVLRDRNCPSILAWLIYNECNPNNDYAVRAAKVCRELDPHCRLSFADCSGKNDEIKSMLQAGDLSFYGINVYDFRAETYTARMKLFTDRPLVFTEWGGWIGQGNPRQLGNLCRMFAQHTRQGQDPRIAGCSFWAWADYEEYSRREPAAIEGWTVEGLVDQRARPKPDLHTLSQMCFEMDHPAPAPAPEVRVLAQAPQREGNWRPVPLEAIAGDQSALEARLAEARWWFQPPVSVFGRLTVAGVDFLCRDASRVYPLLLGEGREEIVIPVGRNVQRVAVLGHVCLLGGYPSSAVWSVHHRNAEPPRGLGQEASQYEFVFEDGTVSEPLLHGVHVLRGNNICRWWKTAPRSAQTSPAAEAVIHPSFEVLRIDLWEKQFAQPRRLNAIRWRLKDPQSIQALYAVSVMEG